jgi:hypothetical protein
MMLYRQPSQSRSIRHFIVSAGLAYVTASSLKVHKGPAMSLICLRACFSNITTEARHHRLYHVRRAQGTCLCFRRTGLRYTLGEGSVSSLDTIAGSSIHRLTRLPLCVKPSSSEICDSFSSRRLSLRDRPRPLVSAGTAAPAGARPSLMLASVLPAISCVLAVPSRQ